MMFEIALTPEEEKYRTRLQRMFPKREGGEAALVERLLEQKRLGEAAVRSAEHVSPKVVRAWEERLQRMFPRKQGSFEERRNRAAQGAQTDVLARTKEPAQLGLWTDVPRVAEPEWNDAPLPVADAGNGFWDHTAVLEMTFEPTAPVIAVTPLELSAKGLCAFEYVGEPADPTAVRVWYTREQLALANCLTQVLAAEDDATAEAIWKEFERV